MNENGGLSLLAQKQANSLLPGLWALADKHSFGLLHTLETGQSGADADIVISAV